RREIVPEEIGWALSGRFTGTLGAIVLLTLMPDRETFMLLFSVAILIAVAMSLAGILIPLSRGSLVAMGIVSGLMGTISSVGAPPMGLIYQGVEPARARATLNAFFSFAALLSLVALAAIGRVSSSDLIAIALFLPVMLVAARLAPRFNRIVDRRYRPIILGLSAIAAINLLIRALA
ncbi:MAG: TSUP family transporter, partial [Hyphomicrobiales bacterium]|nr:TSUP family transporter [Hyphomicrobiales bacterium]